MKSKKSYSINEVREHLTSKIVEDSSTYTDEFGNVHDIDEDIRIADEQIAKMQINVNFRWSKKEIERVKRIADKKGLKYQTYIKSALKQQMDKDEKESFG